MENVFRANAKEKASNWNYKASRGDGKRL